MQGLKTGIMNSTSSDRPAIGKRPFKCLKNPFGCRMWGIARGATGPSFHQMLPQSGVRRQLDEAGGDRVTVARIDEQCRVAEDLWQGSDV
jgi:hypothetical protein